MKPDQTVIDALIRDAQNSRKYRDLGIPDATLLDIILYESEHSRSVKELEERFRKSLHNVIAPYLEEIDYSATASSLRDLHLQNPSDQMLKSWCQSVMSRHASSRERLPYLDLFWQQITEIIGAPASILDLACALDPLGLPWMGVTPATRFVAYDIHQPRLAFLQTFFDLFFPNAITTRQDILTDIPTQKADCAFFFKEAHRFEKRRPGSNKELFDGMNVKWLVVSLPARDLSGHHSLITLHTSLIHKAIQGQPWQLTTRQAGNELIFFIQKHD